MRYAIRPALLAAVLILLPRSGSASPLLTVDEALALAYPNCAVQRQTVYLTKGQSSAAAELSGAPLDNAIAYPYRVHCTGKYAGTAYFETHRVRTHRETLMIALDASDRILRVEVLAFDEPKEYLPKSRWYEQFGGKDKIESLSLKGDIRPITGATLTGRATVAAARKVLALHRVLFSSAGSAVPEAGQK